MKRLSILWLGIMLLVCMTATMPVSATTTLTVNCGTVLRGVTHCASGSLYGVTETRPSDISLVTSLNPRMFTNPARAGSGYQQPTGAAIPVTQRGLSGKVTARLADICPNWPYTFPGMSSWLNLVTSFVNAKKSAGISLYAYEIWNEPVYTWNTANGAFNTMWKQTYDLLRSLDPGVKIMGPSEGYYDRNKMSSFLSFCSSNNCMPDIVSWHELGTDNISYVTRNINDCKTLTSLPISINEYCDPNHALEGQPGSSARYIAKFERGKIDSACISWWFTNAPGRLGSLLANDSGGKGAGWYFYKWYGDMAGNMVSTTAPNDNSNQMDGFASVNGNTVTVLFGGPNDGTCAVRINSLPSGIGSTANVLVQRVDWVNKDTVCSGPITVSQSNYTVSSGSITVTVSGTNGSSGYRLYITPGSGSNPTPTPVSGATRYEAENAARNRCNLFSSSTCSNGQYIGQIDYSDSYVQFTVNVASTKTYTMTVHFANGGTATSTHNVSVNGGTASSISYAPTGGWFNAPNNGSTVTKSVSLNSGSNTIRFTKATNYGEIDYIDIQ